MLCYKESRIYLKIGAARCKNHNWAVITTICIEQRILVLDVLQENSITLTSDLINLDFSNGC